MEETIYDLIEKPQDATQKKRMYRSKFPGNVAPTCSTFGTTTTTNVCGPSNMGGEIQFKPSRSHVRTCGTLGPRDDVPSQLRQPLGPGTVNLPEVKPFSYPPSKKPLVPNPKEKHVISGLKSETDYVTLNALQAMLMPTGERVADRSTSIFKHKNYGKVPSYLKEIKEQIQIESEYLQELREKNTEKQKRGKDNLIQLREEDRLELLQMLRAKYDQTNRDYQSMTHLVILDTIGKVRRKEQYENTLSKLEKDIELLSKPNVLIREE